MREQAIPEAPELAVELQRPGGQQRNEEASGPVHGSLGRDPILSLETALAFGGTAGADDPAKVRGWRLEAWLR